MFDINALFYYRFNEDSGLYKYTHSCRSLKRLDRHLDRIKTFEWVLLAKMQYRFFSRTNRIEYIVEVDRDRKTVEIFNRPRKSMYFIEFRQKKGFDYFVKHLCSKELERKF